MRVMMLTTEYPPHRLGGMGTHVEHLARALSRQGVHVDVFSFAPYDQTVESDGVTVCFFTMSMPDPAPSRRELVRLANRVLVERAAAFYDRLGTRPDVVHTHDWYAMDAACEFRTRCGAPVIGTVHYLHEPFDRTWGGPPRPELAKAEADLSQRADEVIAVSEWLRKAILSVHGANPARVHAVWNGLDFAADEAAVRHDVLGAPAPIGIGVSTRIVLFAGRLVPVKGLLPLMMSARSVLREHEDVVYVCLGDFGTSEFQQCIQDTIDGDETTRSRILLLGKQSRPSVLTWLRRATIAVVPSLDEPFGYAALEAMAAGLPVIATRVGGLPEIIEHDVSGLLVDTTTTAEGRVEIDLAGLVTAQLDLLRDPARASRLGSAGRARAHAAFGGATMAARTAAVYSGVLARGNAVASAAAPEERSHDVR